jgi:hypothetical protein
VYSIREPCPGRANVTMRDASLAVPKRFPVSLAPFPGSNPGTAGFITPDTRIGFAVQAGITLKTPGSGHPRLSDEILGEVGFSRGALDCTELRRKRQ